MARAETAETSDTTVKHLPSDDPSKVTQEELARQVTTLRADIEKMTGLLSRGARQQYDEYKGVARDSARSARRTAEHQADEAFRLAEGYYNDAEESIRRNPTMAVGIATGIGFLIGLLATRR